MTFAERVLAILNETISELIENADEVPESVRLLIEEDLDTMGEEGVEAVANILFAVLLYPMIYGGPDGPDPAIEEALANSPQRVGLEKALASVDDFGRDAEIAGDVGPRFSNLLSYIILRLTNPMKGILWSPQRDEEHILDLSESNEEGEGLLEDGPLSKEDVVRSLQAEGVTAETYQDFCDTFTMYFNQMHDLETISGLLPGLEVAHKGEGVFHVTVEW